MQRFYVMVKKFAFDSRLSFQQSAKSMTIAIIYVTKPKKVAEYNNINIEVKLCTEFYYLIDHEIRAFAVAVVTVFCSGTPISISRKAYSN